MEQTVLQEVKRLKKEIATLLMVNILDTGLDELKSEALEDALRQAFFSLTIAETIYEL